MSWFWRSHFFVVEPTAGRFGCHRKNVDNKPWHGMTIRLAQWLQTTPYPLPHGFRIISDKNRGVGGLLQQQQP